MKTTLNRSVGPKNTLQKLKKIQIFGERNSGTNYLEHLVSRNIKNAQITWELGWKHWFPALDLGFDRSILVLVIHRNVIDWVKSMWCNPWHLPTHITKLNFDRFLREPLAPMAQNSSKSGSEVNKYGHVVYERNPKTNLFFDNLIKLRSEKINSFIRLGISFPQVEHILYEHLNSNPQACLNKLSEKHALVINSKFDKISEYKGRRSFIRGFRNRCRAVFKRILIKNSLLEGSENHKFLMNTLDLDLESQIGYSGKYPYQPREHLPFGF